MYVLITIKKFQIVAKMLRSHRHKKIKMKNDLIFIFDSYIHPCVFSQIAEELLKKPAYAAICASGQAKPNRGAIVAARKQVW